MVFEAVFCCQPLWNVVCFKTTNLKILGTRKFDNFNNQNCKESKHKAIPGYTIYIYQVPNIYWVLMQWLFEYLIFLPIFLYHVQEEAHVLFKKSNMNLLGTSQIFAEIPPGKIATNGNRCHMTHHVTPVGGCSSLPLSSLLLYFDGSLSVPLFSISLYLAWSHTSSNPASNPLGELKPSQSRFGHSQRYIFFQASLLMVSNVRSHWAKVGIS